MHYVGYAPLAAAVSNAGGIGVVTALTQPNAEALRVEIQKTRSLLRSPDIPIGKVLLYHHKCYTSSRQ